MNLRRINIVMFTAVVVFCLNALAQYGQYSQRSLLEKTVYYLAEGKIGSASYWSLPLGAFPCTLKKYFPGEGKIDIDAELNFALLSSGYIEGNGYGSRGKAAAEGYFAIETKDSTGKDTLVKLDISDIDYVYQNGRMVKTKKGLDQNLILACEVNKHTIKRMQIMIWRYDKEFKELKHLKDVPMITAFSFSKDGINRALRAQRAAAK